MKSYEEIEPYWDSDRNKVQFSSSLKHSIPFWWIEECGYSHEATITKRKQYGCSVCSGKVIQAGINDLESNSPALSKEWHPTRNLLKPSEVSKKSSSSFWWQCDKSHEWPAKVLHRVNGSGCPFCSNHKLLQGFNDLATTHPKLTEEWHPTKNIVLPTEVGAGSKVAAWWKCDKGHEWETAITNRTGSKKTGCHECSGFSKSLVNSNAQLDFPHLVNQWSSKNQGNLSNYIGNSSEEFYWECVNGHEWLEPLKKRARSSNLCPICSGHRLVKGTNDLLTVNPVLAKEWHPTLNTFKPSEVTKTSGKKVWWKCEKGHVWEAIIANRANEAGCQECGRLRGSLKRKQPKVGNSVAEKFPLLIPQWSLTLNTLTPQEVNSSSKTRIWWECDKGHIWDTNVSDRTHYNTKCPECSAKQFSSQAEKTIFNYIKSLCPTAEANTRKALPNNQELDIYIPERKLAVEYNGLYWHSERAGKARDYHYDKWLACKEAGIQLIQIWEDEWKRNPEQVKRMLNHKLDVAHGSKIYARQTQVVPLTAQQAKTFLKENHVQGYSTGSYYLGLWDMKKIDGGLVAVLVVKKEAGTEGKTLNIIRYATALAVVGGFTKLLNYAEKTYKPERFITFSDNCVSDGGLYENNGFVADKILKPDYMYVVKGERKHKFGYRLKRFKNDPALLWDEELTEKKLAQLNNIPRIWDAGKTRWVKLVK